MLTFCWSQFRSLQQPVTTKFVLKEPSSRRGWWRRSYETNTIIFFMFTTTGQRRAGRWCRRISLRLRRSCSCCLRQWHCSLSSCPFKGLLQLNEQIFFTSISWGIVSWGPRRSCDHRSNLLKESGTGNFWSGDSRKMLSSFVRPLLSSKSPGSKCLTTDFAAPLRRRQILLAASLRSFSFSDLSYQRAAVENVSKVVGSPSHEGVASWAIATKHLHVELKLQTHWSVAVAPLPWKR